MLYRSTLMSGVAPRTSPRELNKDQAQVAENCRLTSGKQEPWLQVGGTPVVLAKAGAIETVYLYKNLYWFHWNTDVDTVRSPIANNTNVRTYWTGDGAPKMTDDTIALSGGTNYPMNSVLLGIPTPDTDPYHDDPAPSDADNVESRTYIYTWVRKWNGFDEETGPSDPSAIATVTPGDTVTVTFPVAGPTGSYYPSGSTFWKRLYRLKTGTSGTKYQFVKDIAVATPTWADSALTENLGDALITAAWIPPPDDMKGLVELPNGILVGFRENEIIPSVAYQPHVYPQSYRQSITDSIVGIKVFGQSAVVTTVREPRLMTGISPGALSLEKVELQQACSNKRSMVDMGAYVLYASPDGLVAIGPGIARVVTEDLFTEREWRALKPSSIRGYHYDGKYIGFYDTGTKQAGFVFDPGEGSASFSFLSDYLEAGYSDTETDTLYLLDDHDLLEWEGSSSYMTQTRKTGVLVEPKPTNPAAAQVIGGQDASNPLTFKLWADGILVHTETVTDNEAFSLPANYLATDFEVEAIGNRIFEEILIASSMKAIGDG